MRRKPRAAAFPGVNSLIMQLTRTVSGAARESTPNSGGTGTKKTGAPGNSMPPLATVVVVVSMKQMTVSFWARGLRRPGRDEGLLARQQGEFEHLRAFVGVDRERSRGLIDEERC